MAEMAQHPVNLDNPMNEGVAFAIDRFQVRHDWEKETSV